MFPVFVKSAEALSNQPFQPLLLTQVKLGVYSMRRARITGTSSQGPHSTGIVAKHLRIKPLRPCLSDRKMQAPCGTAFASLYGGEGHPMAYVLTQLDRRRFKILLLTIATFIALC